MASVPLDALYQRARYIVRNEGWRTFVRRGFSFVGNLFFSHGNYYIYEKDLNSTDEEIKFKPKIDCAPKVVSSPEGLDELIAQGHDFKAMNFRRKLEKGAIAFCFFAGKELVHVTWLAPNKEAKQEIDYLPFKVDFEAGEVCSGASFTDPAHRGKGLFSPIYSLIFSYLAKGGTLKDKFTIEVSNVASQRALAKFNPVTTGKGRYLKILGWQSWKESPMEGTKQ